jgi:hypothetical protein
MMKAKETKRDGSGLKDNFEFEFKRDIPLGTLFTEVLRVTYRSEGGRVAEAEADAPRPHSHSD